MEDLFKEGIEDLRKGISDLSKEEREVVKMEVGKIELSDVLKGMKLDEAMVGIVGFLDEFDYDVIKKQDIEDVIILGKDSDIDVFVKNIEGWLEAANAKLADVVESGEYLEGFRKFKNLYSKIARAGNPYDLRAKTIRKNTIGIGKRVFDRDYKVDRGGKNVKNVEAPKDLFNPNVVGGKRVSKSNLIENKGDVNSGLFSRNFKESDRGPGEIPMKPLAVRNEEERVLASNGSKKSEKVEEDKSGDHFGSDPIVEAARKEADERRKKGANFLSARPTE